MLETIKDLLLLAAGGVVVIALVIGVLAVQEYKNRRDS